jgi:hypothetical protein
MLPCTSTSVPVASTSEYSNVGVTISRYPQRRKTPSSEASTRRFFSASSGR